MHIKTTLKFVLCTGMIHLIKTQLILLDLSKIMYIGERKNV